MSSPRARIGMRKSSLAVAQWVCCGLVIYLIWAYALTPSISNAFFAAPAAVFRLVWSWLGDGTAWSLASTTLGEALTGFVIGSAIGIVLALAIGLLPATVGEVTEPFVTAIYTAPKFVFIPILFIWLGADFAPRAVLVVLAVFPVVTIYTLVGVRTLDPDRATMMRMVGASRLQLAGKLLLPHTAGYVATGMTVVLPQAMFMAIGAEILFGTSSGLGGRMYTQAELFNGKDVLAALVIATVLSGLLIGGVGRVTDRLLRMGGLTR
jgi:NitT/TauT family transport system permease protein